MCPFLYILPPHCVTAVHIFRCRDVNKMKQVLPENGLERKGGRDRRKWVGGGCGVARN